jgi:hypothetical protein
VKFIAYGVSRIPPGKPRNRSFLPMTSAKFCNEWWIPVQSVHISHDSGEMQTRRKNMLLEFLLDSHGSYVECGYFVMIFTFTHLPM